MKMKWLVWFVIMCLISNLAFSFWMRHLIVYLIFVIVSIIFTATRDQGVIEMKRNLVKVLSSILIGTSLIGGTATTFIGCGSNYKENKDTEPVKVKNTKTKEEKQNEDDQLVVDAMYNIIFDTNVSEPDAIGNIYYEVKFRNDLRGYAVIGGTIEFDCRDEGGQLIDTSVCTFTDTVMPYDTSPVSKCLYKGVEMRASKITYNLKDLKSNEYISIYLDMKLKDSKVFRINQQ